VKVLFFGDIVGSLGITAVSDVLRSLVKRYGVDLVIANGENATRGFGINYRDANALKDAGVDVITLGNHWHNRRSIDEFIEEIDGLIRPYNVRDVDEGRGLITLDVHGVPVTVVNLLGTAFMKEEVTSPSVCMYDIIDQAPQGIIIVDYHAESTSEKSTFAHYFDGQVSAVVGTHTHVQTNDARVLPLGTAFISDVGMCGQYDSVIGFEPKSVVERIIYGDPHPMEIATEGEKCINAVLMEFDDETFMARSIRPLFYIEGKERVYGEDHL